MERNHLLDLEIDIYNGAMKLQWEKDKVSKNLSGDLSTCKHCKRLYSICCICDEAEKRWEEFIEEVKNVSGSSTDIKEKAEEMVPFEFVLWYSGMSEDKIRRAYERFKRENQ